MADSSVPFPVQFCSDIDGGLYAIVDERDGDLTGWRIESVSESGDPYVSGFERAQFPWWLNGNYWNGLGYGEPRQPWSAVFKRGYRIVRWMPPSQG